MHTSNRWESIGHGRDARRMRWEKNNPGETNLGDIDRARTWNKNNINYYYYYRYYHHCHIQWRIRRIHRSQRSGKRADERWRNRTCRNIKIVCKESGSIFGIAIKEPTTYVVNEKRSVIVTVDICLEITDEEKNKK